MTALSRFSLHYLMREKWELLKAFVRAEVLKLKRWNGKTE